MKKLVVACLAVGGVALASNGTYTIGLSPVSKGMGGTGVAASATGIDANFKNPSLLGGAAATGKVTAEAYFTSVKLNAKATTSSLALGNATAVESKADSVYYPVLGVTYKVDDQITFGLSGAVYGGVRTDYSGNASLINLKSTANLIRLALGASYTPTPNFSFGVAPILNYSELSEKVGLPTQRGTELHGDTAIGAIIGFSGKPLPGLTVGASIQPKIEHEQSEIVDLDSLPFNNGALDNITIDEPTQIAAGVAYQFTPTIKATVDYRFINWNSADAYSALDWQDQHVIAVGTEVKFGGLAVRVGYNYAKSPIRDVAGENGAATVAMAGKLITKEKISILNMLAFPGTTESNITAGLGYEFSSALKADLSVLYAPDKTITRAGTGTSGAYSYATTTNQLAIVAGASYQF